MSGFIPIWSWKIINIVNLEICFISGLVILDQKFGMKKR